MTVDLHHHGDRDATPGLIDLAVNVRVTSPPPWLAAVIGDTIADLGRYPDPTAATHAIAERHGVPVEAVLPTSGGAEAFTLIARALRPQAAVVVHPQFTEPEAALRAAGHRPTRHLLSPATGFALEVDELERAHGQADLVFVGNPTNPTGVLHSADRLHALRRPGRTLVVDEAFMDAVPGEPESVIGDSLQNLRGLLVLRSLTKTWGLAGLRAGYVVGDPDLIAALGAAQPPWSVSTPALAAMVATATPAAVAEAQAAAGRFDSWRTELEFGLAEVGLPVRHPSRAPFVLIDTSAFGPGSLRAALGDRGLAVRRGESFPGLGPTWIRVAVRHPAISRQLVAALADVRESSRAA
ncbi:aminotransferase [Humibacillus sp. DSM 29435]|uniref:Rv2231c family pyridoxal phosphate-dependent protein CobC n=1 Tax=Humibacillus sp. DSM 29435 TaxID=1869167 RepID=UPI000872CCCF|nr:Rv2231c family pyridoxal phosphate-dependent protein CobC [Humibacillus sp. DSM 29435]OFE17852.1 aminotransferase [Humibacillus sp. DSM 29435]